MKKLLLATAVAALSVSAAQAAPTVYGKIFMTADYVDQESNNFGLVDYDENGVQINSNFSRIGLKGSEAVSANTDVIYQLEYGIDVDADDHQTFRNRDTYLGLKNNTFGELRVGNIQSTTDYVNNVVVNPAFWDNLGTDVSSINLDTGEVGALNMADSGRRSNSVIWKAPKYQGLPLQFAAMYVNDDDITTNDSGWGASVMFDQGTGFTAGLAYDKDANIAGSILRGTATVDLAKVAGTSVPLTLGALYQVADYDARFVDDASENWLIAVGEKKEKGFVLSAEMGLTNFAKPASVYAQYNNTSNITGVEDLDSQQLVIGGKYSYKSNMIAHAYVGKNEVDIDNADADTFAVGGGLEYLF